MHAVSSHTLQHTVLTSRMPIALERYLPSLIFVMDVLILPKKPYLIQLIEIGQDNCLVLLAKVDFELLAPLQDVWEIEVSDVVP